MVRFFSSLRFRLLLLVLLAVIPALGVVIHTASEQRQLVKVQTEQNALRVAKTAAGGLEHFAETTHQLLIELAQVPAVRDSETEACNAFLASVLKKYPGYQNLSVSDAQGSVFCSAIPTDKPLNILDDDFVPHVLSTRDFAVGEYRFMNGTSVLGMGYPLFDETGEAQDVVIASFFLSSLNKLVTDSMLPPGSTLTITDCNGTIVARYPDPDIWVGKSIPETPRVRINQIQQSEGIFEAVGADNVSRLYAFTPVNGVPENDLVVSVGIPTEVAFAEVNQILVRNLITLGLVAALALAVAWVGTDLFLLRQMKALLNTTSRIASGDLGARTGLRYGTGELGQLACVFDQMAEKLEKHDGERKQAEEQVRRWSIRLEGLINAIAEATSQPLETNRIVEVALDKTLNVMDLAAGCVLLKHGEDFILVAHNGISEEVVQSIQRLIASEIATNEITGLVHSEGTQKITDTALLNVLTTADEQLRTWVGVPIKSKGRTFGLMCLGSKETQGLEANEQGVLAAVGQQVGVAIENAELYEQVKSIAALKERERLSRELHDGLAQVLGYLCTSNKVAADLVATGETDRARAQIQDMQRTLQEAYQDMRESILGLRMTVSPNGGLWSALKEYTHKFSVQMGIRVNMVTNGDDQLECSPEAEVQLLRIIQEALSNIRKHSGARQVWIRFEPNGDSVAVIIEDNGKGFNTDTVNHDGQPHFGLQTMQERAESVGGSLVIWSQPDHGAKVVVTLPLDHEGV